MTFWRRMLVTVHYFRAMKRAPLSQADYAERKRATNEALRRKLRWDATVERMCVMAVAEALGIDEARQ